MPAECAKTMLGTAKIKLNMNHAEMVGMLNLEMRFLACINDGEAKQFT